MKDIWLVTAARQMSVLKFTSRERQLQERLISPKQAKQKTLGFE